MLEVFSFKNTDVDRRIDSVDLIMVNLKFREIAILVKEWPTLHSHSLIKH
jgi:hypothetical protein